MCPSSTAIPNPTILLYIIPITYIVPLYLLAGKDWVDDIKQGELSAFEYSKQREERLKLLKAQTVSTRRSID